MIRGRVRAVRGEWRDAIVSWALDAQTRVSAAAIDECLRAEWRTNVRGFKGIVGSAEELADAAKRAVIEPADILRAIRAASTGNEQPAAPPRASQAPQASRSLAEELDLHRREIVIETYRRLGSVSKAAKALGIARNTMYEALRKYGVAIGDDEE